MLRKRIFVWEEVINWTKIETNKAEWWKGDKVWKIQQLMTEALASEWKVIKSLNLFLVDIAVRVIITEGNKSRQRINRQLRFTVETGEFADSCRIDSFRRRKQPELGWANGWSKNMIDVSNPPARMTQQLLITEASTPFSARRISCLYILFSFLPFDLSP